MTVGYNWDSGRGLLLSSVDYPDGVANAGRVTYYGYDSAGRRAVERGPTGVETWWVRDAAGRVTTQVGPVAVARTCGPTSCVFPASPPAGPTESWVYDLTGQVRSYTDAEGAVTTTAVSYPGGGGRTEIVTEPGHGDTAADPSSRVATVTTSTFDPFDRLVSVERGDPADPASVATTTYTHDPLGRVATMARSVGPATAELVESYGYDAEGMRWPGTST